MTELPTVGGSGNVWGNLLLDFLGVSLNADGTLKAPILPRTAVSDANYTILATDYLVAYTALTAARTATLPAAAASNAGQMWIVKDESGAAATYAIAVKTSGGNIDGVSGSTGKTISINYGKLYVYSSGGNYYTLESLPVKSGLAQISGGALQFGVPTNELFTGTVGTTGLNANQIRYVFFKVDYPITITAWQFDVSATPASNANVRVGIYRADGAWQPIGAPLYDNGGTAVANGFTGVKSATGLSVALAPGRYLTAINMDIAMSMRAYQVGSRAIDGGMGTTPIVQKVVNSQTYGALPTPGTVWNATNLAAGGMQHSVLWQWTE